MSVPARTMHTYTAIALSEKFLNSAWHRMASMALGSHIPLYNTAVQLRHNNYFNQ